MYVWVIGLAELTGGSWDGDMHLLEEVHDTVSPLTPQVPQDEWGPIPLGKDEEIPCRRMRSGSYVKAMAEDDSGDSDGSPKTLAQDAGTTGQLPQSHPAITHRDDHSKVSSKIYIHCVVSINICSVKV